MAEVLFSLEELADAKDVGNHQEGLLAQKTKHQYNCNLAWQIGCTCGSRQVVRRQPSKLISAGSNPVSRSPSVISVSDQPDWQLITGH